MHLGLHTAGLDALLAGAGVGLLVAFGSRARGTAHGASDLDLGVLRADGARIAHRPLAQLALQLAERSDAEVDLVDLATADALIRMEIARDGHVVFADSPERWPDFVARTLIDHDDIAWAIERCVDAVLAPGAAR